MKKFLTTLFVAALASASFVSTNSAQAASSDSIALYFSSPFVSGSHLSGEGVNTESFDGMSAGACASPSAVGTITGTCVVEVTGNPAQTPTATPAVGGNLSNFVSNSNGSVYTFNNPVKYVGIYWFSGNGGNQIQFYDSSDVLIATLNSADIISFLGTPGYAALTNADTGTLTTVGGQTVQRRYYYRAPLEYTGTVDAPVTNYNTVTYKNEPWAYLNLFVSGDIAVKKVVLSGTGFEIDNVTTADWEASPTNSMILVKSVLGTTPSTQTIAWAPTNTTADFSAGALTPNALATVTNPVSGGGAISYSVENAGTSGCTVDSVTGVVTATANGTCLVTATAAAVNGSPRFYATSKSQTFTFSALPTITAVAPTSGTAEGGTPVTITGTNFVEGATVTVGGVACTSVVVVSATSITCVTPAGTVGAQNVVVTNPDNGSATSNGAYTYNKAFRAVTFMANGGTGTLASSSKNAASALPSNSFVRAGYVFAGWNTAADGTGMAYANKASYSFDADLTLYAQWTKAQAVAKLKKNISIFAGDKAVLTSKMKAEIATFVKKLPKKATISCVGSTSGSKITAFDKKLANDRAMNVCVQAVKVRGDLKYTLKVNPSSSPKVTARNVWIYQK